MNSNSFPKVALAALAGGLLLGSALTAKAAAPSPESAPALCDLGKALVHEGKPGPAILAFERAQQLAPRDPAIAVNLQAVRETAGLVDPPTAWWQSAAHSLTMNEWAWSGSLALAFVCAAMSFSRFFPARLRQLMNALSVTCAVAVLVAIGALWLRWPELSRAVVVNPHVTALIAPAESAAPVFPLAEGEIVTAKKALRNFVLVRTADGRSGWVSREQVKRIIPAPDPDRAS
jgi:hypothetical protein